MWDLSQLGRMYGPTLCEDSLDQLSKKAARALLRSAHRPGVMMRVAMQPSERCCELHWIQYPPGDKKSIDDDYNVTEYAAMAVALLIVYTVYPERGWAFMRRTVRGEFADIVLVDNEDAEFFIDVSGSAGVDAGRLAKKRAQLEKCSADFKAACVVEFGPPRAQFEEMRSAS